jgi:hypothetical protein
MAFVYDVCMDEGETDPEKLRERALELVSEVLFSGLMVAGEVDPKFVPWDLSAAESFARIRDEWMATTPQIYPFDIGWLDLTPAGEARAREMLAREGVEWL